MSLPVATLVFFALLAGAFLVPLLPAWRELRGRHDADALPIAADGRVSPSYFADRFRGVLRQRLSGPMQEVRATSTPMHGAVDGQDAFVVLPAAAPVTDETTRECMVVGVGDLNLPDGVHALRELYVEGDLLAGDQVVVRATLVDGHARFGAGAVSLRWLHAASDVTFGPQAHLQGRVSCGACLRVGGSTVFERLHAPRIEFGEPTRTTVDTPATRRDMRPDELPADSETVAGRTLVPADLEIPAGTRWVGDLVVRGRLRCGVGAQILGSVKAEDIRLEENVEVEGSVVSRSHVLAREGVRISGLVLAEEHVDLGRACRVGIAPDTASIRAASIDVGNGTVVHGSVWVDADEGQVSA